MKNKNIYTLFTLLLIIKTAFAGDIDKGFKYLTEKNYAKAKLSFEKVLFEKPMDVAANFGLSKFYAAKDNAQEYNIEMAYDKVVVAKNNFVSASANSKDQKQLTEFQISENSILDHILLIESLAAEKAKLANSIEAYTSYLNKYAYDKKLFDLMKAKRNEMAYEKAKSEGSHTAYKEFIDKYIDADQYNLANDAYQLTLFEFITKDKTVDSYASYIKSYPNGKHIEKATQIYDRILFENATKDGSVESYNKFINDFPKSPFIEDARLKYEKVLFESKTAEGTVESYLSFLTNYPNSVYLKDAEDKIYNLTTKEQTPIAYVSFINKYPKNSNIELAWDRIYELEINDLDTSSYVTFLKKYSNYPQKTRVETIIQQNRKDLYPIKGANGLDGYMDANSKLYIPMTYNDARNFKQGMAAVKIENKWGYINKGNILVIEPKYEKAFDFSKDEIARIKLNSKWGFIDKKGEYVIPITYEALGEFIDGLAKAKKGGKWGFIDKNNSFIIPNNYDKVEEFYKGMCKVKKDNKYLYVDKQGRPFYPPED